MATSTSTMPSHLHFPPEVWSLTIQNFRHHKSPEDLTYLWTTVRQVSKQFRQEIEEIYRTEHLPRTWVHVNTGESSRILPPSQTKSITDTVLRRKVAISRSELAKTSPDWSQPRMFDYQMDYQIQPKYPDRAYFSNDSVPGHNILKGLQDQIGAGMLSQADKSIPGSRIRFFESPVGMFVVQVRGVVGDCALPGLSINASRNELSFEWKKLFNRIFGERKLVTVTLHGALVGHLCFLNPFSSIT